jgi:hypothetical protein
MRPGTFGGERPGKCTEEQREGPELQSFCVRDWSCNLKRRNRKRSQLEGKGRDVAQGGKLPVLVDANLRKIL